MVFLQSPIWMALGSTPKSKRFDFQGRGSWAVCAAPGLEFSLAGLLPFQICLAQTSPHLDLSFIKHKWKRGLGEWKFIHRFVCTSPSFWISRQSFNSCHLAFNRDDKHIHQLAKARTTFLFSSLSFPSSGRRPMRKGMSSLQPGWSVDLR